MLSGVLELASALMPPPPTCGQQSSIRNLTQRRLPSKLVHCPASPGRGCCNCSY